MTTQRIFVLCLTFMLDSILFVRIGCFLCHRINEFCLVNIHAVRENSVFLFRAVSVLLHKRVRYVIGRLTPEYDWASPTPIQDLSRFDSCLPSIFSNIFNRTSNSKIVSRCLHP